MKKIIIALLVVVLAIGAVSCKSAPKEIDLAALKTKIESSDLFVDSLVNLSTDRQKSIVLLPTDTFESSEFYITSSASGEEYGLFKCNTEDDAKALVTFLEGRRDEQHELYASYAVDALPRIDNSVIKQSGVYVVYVVADNYTEASKIVDEAFA